MNTPDNWKTTATVTNPERREFWQSIFGTDRVPIVSLLPTRANLPGHPAALIYMLDLKVISEEQRSRLIQAIADKFDLDPYSVESDIDWHGVPILADDVIVATSDPSVIANLLF